MRTTKQVWEHHCIAFANADIEEVIADFAPDAIYVSKDKVVKGKELIREMYDAHFKSLLPGATSTIISETIAGELVLFEWEADSPLASIINGVDTFVIRDGFIIAQTMRCTVVTK